MPVLIFLGIAVWFVIGDPPKTAANWFWDEGPAPWESVDAYYYPNRSDLTVHEMAEDVGDLDDCRTWVRSQASLRGDPGLARGDYECGVGRTDSAYGFNVYRITAR